MKLAVTSEMRAIDQKSINDYGIPGIVLMENAGVAVARQVRQILGNIVNKQICIFAGKGNNGGDGYVAARHLHNGGARVKVILLAKKAEIRGDARCNLDIIDLMGIDIQEIAIERDWDQVEIATTFADCLVDGLLGTGFHGAVSGELLRLIAILNRVDKPLVAIDIPSGVNADTGAVGSVAVKATHTVTLALGKPGLFLYPGAGHVGQLAVADIGIPVSLLSAQSIQQGLITRDLVRSVLPARRPDAHKGTCGRVFVVAGSRGMTGAAALASMGALRCGAGLVTLGIAHSLHDIMEVKLTEVMTVPLADRDGDIVEAALAGILAAAKPCSVLAIGPGLGQREHTARLVQEVIAAVDIPLVIDADALNALVGCTEFIGLAQALPILTPHPGEMARLTGLKLEDIQADRIGIARKFSAEWGCILVLKGAPTVVAFPDGEIFVNTTGNAGMATGGTGDVLTGMIASLIAQGLSSHWAAVAAVYLHGLAGDIAANSARVGLVAGDLLSAVPEGLAAVLVNE